MQYFPLLRLPGLALTDALKCLTPIELFELSQCSRKMVELIKQADTQRFLLSVNFSKDSITINDKFRFTVRKIENNDYDFEKERYRHFGSNDKKLKVLVHSVSDSDDKFISFWIDKFEGLKTICFHFTKIFGCKIDCFDTGYCFPIKKFRSMIEEILETQSEIGSLTISKVDFKDEDLVWTLDNVKITKMLEILVQQSENFQYNFKSFPKILKIYYASWFTIDNLLSLNSCKVIELISCNLTNQDLGVFINLWKTGEYTELEYLEMYSKNLKYSEPLSMKVAGLISLWNTDNLEVKEKRIDGYYCKIEKGVNIQRDNGTIGTLFMNEGPFKFLI